nr:hypothetical protein [bacterium]
REATTGELATLAWLHLLVGRPEAAVRALSEFDADPVVAGAAFLMAGWRYRLRDNEGFFEDIVMPGIKKAFLMERFAADEAGPSDLGRAPWLEIPIVDELPKVIEAAAKKNASVLLDLGAGDLPFGLEYAAQTSGIHAISIEPDVHPIDWSSIDVRFPPLNHSFLMGRAEELVPFAAESPIAQDAVIVAPGEQSVMSMMLSALLAVEPGGEIFVFQNMEDMLPVDLLQSMGLEVEIFSVDTGKYDPPPSRYLAREGEIRMARIRVSQFGGRRFGGVASGSLRSAGDEGAFERTGRLLKLVLPGPEEENAASVKGSEAAFSSSVTTTRSSTGAKIIPFSK